MLIEHDIQVSLLWLIELLVCAVALLGAFIPKYRAACILMFCMVALDLYLWPFFDSLPSGPNRYYACLGMNAIFILLNYVFARPKITLMNMALLAMLSILNIWEALDVTFNPNKSFIDYNYALLVAVSYFIYIISITRGLTHERAENDTSADNNIDIIPISPRYGNKAYNQRTINQQGKV